MRRGAVAFFVATAPNVVTDSSQGRPSAMPVPRRKRRRDRVLLMRSSVYSTVQKLPAVHNCEHGGGKVALPGFHLLGDGGEKLLVGGQHLPAQGVAEEFPCEMLRKLRVLRLEII